MREFKFFVGLILWFQLCDEIWKRIKSLEKFFCFWWIKMQSIELFLYEI